MFKRNCLSGYELEAGVCPGLYRDKQGRFICSFANIEVDPGVMPCLGSYEECIYYTRRQEVVAEERREVVEERREAVVELPKPLAEEVVERVSPEEKLLNALRALEEELVSLGRLWEEYERNAKLVLERWEELSREARHVIAGVKSSINACRLELEELEARHKLGLVLEEAYSELKEEIESKIQELEGMLKQIEEALSESERLIAPHFKRVKAAEAKPEIAKIRLSLMKLDQMYRDGKVSEEVYRRVKSELEKRLAKLERLLAEVE